MKKLAFWAVSIYAYIQPSICAGESVTFKVVNVTGNEDKIGMFLNQILIYMYVPALCIRLLKSSYMEKPVT